MKQVAGWWFAPTDRKLANGDRRDIKIGETHTIDGDIIPCERGLHLSKRPLDALRYAPGPVVYRVIGGGIIVPHGNPVDKYACSRRAYLAGGVDASEMLWAFGRRCALDVVHLWDAPQIVVDYLQTGDESKRDAAWAAARDAAWAAARDAARAAAWAAARAAAWDAAWAAARDAAWAAAWAAARAAAWEKQNRVLTNMLNSLLEVDGGKA